MYYVRKPNRPTYENYKFLAWYLSFLLRYENATSRHRMLAYTKIRKIRSILKRKRVTVFTRPFPKVFRERFLTNIVEFEKETVLRVDNIFSVVAVHL